MSDSRLPTHVRIITSIPWKPIFQRLPGIWLLALFPFAFLAPVYLPTIFGAYYFILHVFFFINNTRSAYGTYVGYNSAKLYSTTDWLEKYCEATSTSDGSDTRHDLPYDSVVHTIILPNYKETVETLCETLDVLASHRRALTQYRVCLAMEESEQGSEEKAKMLMKRYADSFLDITFSIHPIGRPAEIRGKSSNVAWAAFEMARRYNGGLQGRQDHVILTVMDADTCFAEDYFNSAAYHYCVASPEQRKIMMFAPCTVFDRNAKDVPIFVRVTDMFWSIGVMSNLYTSSPVKIPCSAYSVSMDLAIAVSFWDAGPEAIGEDMHMYLKCFFSTEGRVIVKSIFSPASQCNIEGEGEGIKGYISGVKARYTQGMRHLWGSLDTGYALRRSIVGIACPGHEQVIQLKNAQCTKLDKHLQTSNGNTTNFSLWTLINLFHRLLEAHILMGQLFTLITISAIILPIRSTITYPIAIAVWSRLSSEPLHPYVELSLYLSFWVRMACIIPNVIMIYYYEKYHHWCGFERWALAAKHQQSSSSLSTHQHHSYPASVDNNNNMFGGIDYDSLIRPQHAHLKVQPLGKRPTLYSVRVYPWSLLDWTTVAMSGFLYYVLPQFVAQTSQLFTERLEYKVAAKPVINKSGNGGLPLSSSVPMSQQTTTTTASSISKTATPLSIHSSTTLYSGPRSASALDSKNTSYSSNNNNGARVSSMDGGYFLPPTPYMVQHHVPTSLSLSSPPPPKYEESQYDLVLQHSNMGVGAMGGMGGGMGGLKMKDADTK
ncbi:hypothetical protein HK102_011507, partial [Quaeritorhiza haematococci]